MGEKVETIPVDMGSGIWVNAGQLICNTLYNRLQCCSMEELVAARTVYWYGRDTYLYNASLEQCLSLQRSVRMSCPEQFVLSTQTGAEVTQNDSRYPRCIAGKPESSQDRFPRQVIGLQVIE